MAKRIARLDELAAAMKAQAFAPDLLPRDGAPLSETVATGAASSYVSQAATTTADTLDLDTLLRVIDAVKLL